MTLAIRRQLTAVEQTAAIAAFRERRWFLIRSWVYALGCDGNTEYWAAKIRLCNDAAIALGMGEN